MIGRVLVSLALLAATAVVGVEIGALWPVTIPTGLKISFALLALAELSILLDYIGEAQR
jgi:hypothetical protein